MYLEALGIGHRWGDEFAPLAQCAFDGVIPSGTDTLRFNTDVTLGHCPNQPSSVAQPADAGRPEEAAAVSVE